MQELQAWKAALVDAKRSSYCLTSVRERLSREEANNLIHFSLSQFRPRSESRHSAASAQDGALADPQLPCAIARPTRTAASQVHSMLRSPRISVSMSSLLFTVRTCMNIAVTKSKPNHS